ncbi:MAG: SDR family NAD(P)-dependent oxidoreductase [Candidatus Geothermincolia bacterium]
MADFRGKVVVITGAAHGLGEATAKAFAARGARLALCDIDGEGLRTIKGVLEARGAEVMTDIVDVAQAWQVEEFSDKVFKEMGGVDVLVNNAGVAVAGKLEDMKLEDWQWIMGINMWGVVHGSHFFYPRMAQRGSGHIVNISSAAGLIPLPMLSAYSGIKSAILAMTRIWRAEGAVSGVGFTAVCPGFMTTNISKSARTCSGTRRRSPSQFGEMVDKFFIRGQYDPAKVAEAIVRAVDSNKGIVRAGFETHLVDWINRFSRSLTDFILRVSVKFGERWA